MKQFSCVPTLAGQMLPPVSPSGLASRSCWTLTSAGDAHSQAFHLHQVSEGKKCTCASHPVPSTLGLSGPTTLHLILSGWKDFSSNIYQEQTIQTAQNLSSNTETTSAPMDKEAHPTCQWRTVTSAMEMTHCIISKQGQKLVTWWPSRT